MDYASLILSTLILSTFRLNREQRWLVILVLVVNLKHHAFYGCEFRAETMTADGGGYISFNKTCGGKGKLFNNTVGPQELP